MKKGMILIAMALLAACTTTPTEVQSTPEPVIAVGDLQVLVEMQGQLAGANAQFDAMATQIAGLGNDLSQLNERLALAEAGLTQLAQVTPEPIISPTVTPTATATTSSSGLPSGTMYVIAKAKLNLREISGYNDQNVPIMVIAEPRVQYEAGEWIVVKVGTIKADGGDLYYEVVSPRGAGLYVRVEDVTKA